MAADAIAIKDITPIENLWRGRLMHRKAEFRDQGHNQTTTDTLSGYLNRIRRLGKRWKGQWKYFSPAIAFYDFLFSCVLRFSNSKLKHIVSDKCYRLAQVIIEDKYSNIIEKYKQYDKVIDKEHAQESCNTYETALDTNIKPEDPIFIFWWQGGDTMPDICRICVDSIIKHSGGHPVKLIDKFNYKEYADIPDYVQDKMGKGVINFTAFSDILRWSLLSLHGGIWVDPTCLMTDEFDNNIYNFSFYTIKHGDDWEFPICKGLWSTFFLAVGEKSLLAKYMKEMLYTFWKNENAQIVYLMMDLFLSIAYDHFEWARKIIDTIPYNNAGRDKLRKYLESNKNNNHNFQEKACGITDIIKKNHDTYIYKLTYKMSISSEEKEVLAKLENAEQ